MDGLSGRSIGSQQQYQQLIDKHDVSSLKSHKGRKLFSFKASSFFSKLQRPKTGNKQLQNWNITKPKGSVTPQLKRTAQAPVRSSQQQNQPVQYTRPQNPQPKAQQKFEERPAWLIDQQRTNGSVTPQLKRTAQAPVRSSQQQNQPVQRTRPQNPQPKAQQKFDERPAWLIDQQRISKERGNIPILPDVPMKGLINTADGVRELIKLNTEITKQAFAGQIDQKEFNSLRHDIAAKLIEFANDPSEARNVTSGITKHLVSDSQLQQKLVARARRTMGK